MSIFNRIRRQSINSQASDEENQLSSRQATEGELITPSAPIRGSEGVEPDLTSDSDESKSNGSRTTSAPPALSSKTVVSEKSNVSDSILVNGTLVIGDGGTYRISGKPSLMSDSVPDIELDWGLVDGIEVRSASIRGRTHRYEGSVRQDSCNIASISGVSDSYLFLCVADGLGSYPKSHIAARESSLSAAENFKDLLREAVSLESIDANIIIERIECHLLELLRRQEANRNLSLREVGERMRTTLSIALIRNIPNEEGVRHGKTFTIGDTSAWILQKEGSWKPITPVKGANTDVFSSSVSAIPSFSGVTFAEREFVLRKGDAFFLMSDGIGDPLGDGSGLVGEALGAQLRTAPDIYDFARICDFARRTHMDDRTLVGIWMPSE